MDRRDFILAASAIGGAAAAAPVSQAASLDVASPVASRSAMLGLLKALDSLQADYLSPAWRIQSANDIAEGERLLLHLLNTAINFWLEADAERPVFTPYTTPTRKLLGDNPDALYYFAPVRPDRSYRIRGNLAGASFTSFTVEGGSAAGGTASASTAAIDDAALAVGPDGSFEIIASPEKPPAGVWLPLAASAGQITTRHYFESRNCIVNQPGFQVPLTIEALAPPPLAAAPI